MTAARRRAFPPEELARRRPVWWALSDLFLDTELQPSDHVGIARTLRDSGYDDATLLAILDDEVGRWGRCAEPQPKPDRSWSRARVTRTPISGQPASARSHALTPPSARRRSRCLSLPWLEAMAQGNRLGKDLDRRVTAKVLVARIHECSGEGGGLQ